MIFVFNCFDRIVTNGYLSGLSRPEQVVHFFRQVIGVPIVSKEVLAQRTLDYQNWVEAFAANHKIPIEWAQKGVRKEDQVLPWLRRIRKKAPTESISSSRAWNKGPPSGSASPSIRPGTPTTGSWRINAAASRTTTSTFTMKCSDRWWCAWLHSCRSRPPIISTATPSSNRNSREPR